MTRKAGKFTNRGWTAIAVTAAAASLAVASTGSAATLINERGDGESSASLDTVRNVAKPRYTRVRIAISGSAVGVPYTRDEWGDKIWGAAQAIKPKITGFYSIVCRKSSTSEYEYVQGTLRARAVTRRLPVVRPDRCTIKVDASADASDVPGLTNVQPSTSQVAVKVTTRK